MNTTISQANKLTITFSFEGKRKTKRVLEVGWDRLESLLEEAEGWEGGGPGRKVYAYCIGHFTTTRVSKLLSLWLPKQKEAQP